MEPKKRFVCHIEGLPENYPEFCLEDICCGIYYRKTIWPTLLLWLLLLVLIVAPILYYVFYIYAPKRAKAKGDLQSGQEASSDGASAGKNKTRPPKDSKDDNKNNKLSREDKTLNEGDKDGRVSDKPTDGTDKDNAQGNSVGKNTKDSQDSKAETYRDKNYENAEKSKSAKTDKNRDNSNRNSGSSKDSEETQFSDQQDDIDKNDDSLNQPINKNKTPDQGSGNAKDDSSESMETEKFDKKKGSEEYKTGRANKDDKDVKYKNRENSDEIDMPHEIWNDQRKSNKPNMREKMLDKVKDEEITGEDSDICDESEITPKSIRRPNVSKETLSQYSKKNLEENKNIKTDNNDKDEYLNRKNSQDTHQVQDSFAEEERNLINYEREPTKIQNFKPSEELTKGKETPTNSQTKSERVKSPLKRGSSTDSDAIKRRGFLKRKPSLEKDDSKTKKPPSTPTPSKGGRKFVFKY